MKELLFLFFLAISHISLAQAKPNQETERLTQLYSTTEGTYQIQIINSRELPAFPLSILDSIVAVRHESMIKYIWLKDNTRIKVFPKNVIDNKDFIKPIRIAYISSEDLN